MAGAKALRSELAWHVCRAAGQQLQHGGATGRGEMVPEHLHWARARMFRDQTPPAETPAETHHGLTYSSEESPWLLC